MKTLSPLKSLHTLLFAKHKKPLIYSVIFTVLTVLSSTGLMAYSAYIISFSALMPSIAEIMVAITIVRFLGIGRAILRYTERLMSHNAVFLYLSQLRIKIFQHVSQFTSENIVNLNRKNTFNLLTTDIEQLQDYFLRGLLPLLGSILLWLIATVCLWQISKIQAFLFFIFYPITTLGIAWFINRFTKNVAGEFSNEKKAYHSEFSSFAEFHTLLKWQGIKSQKRINANQQAIKTEGVCEQLNRGLIFGSNLQQVLINFHVLFSIVIGIFLVQSGELKGLWLATFVLATFSLYEAAPTVLNFFIKTSASRQSAENLMTQMINEPNKHTSNLENNLSSLTDLKTESPALEVINYEAISYRFLNSDFKLEFPPFSIEKGKHIAIVGPSGSGKSTLAGIMSGFYEEQNKGERSNNFSVVNQEIYLFNDRLISNLFVNEDHPKLKKALDCAGLEADYWIKTNPWIGEDGMRLSGGQRQRLGLARAILRDKPFLILDEAFSGLELVKEKEIMENLLTQTEHTLIWITHRLIGMDKMKVIYVMDKGCLVAKGTHDDLMATCQLYQSLANNA